MKHTPGPWRVIPKIDTGYMLFGGVFYLGSIESRDTPERNEANARLVSVAPELLAALIEARHALQFANDTPNGPIVDTIWMMHRPETLFDFMDAMIAKATGES